MEKILYLLRIPEEQSMDEFKEKALTELKDALMNNARVLKVRMAFEDHAVAPAEIYKQEQRPPAPQALISVWVTTSNDQQQLVSCLSDYCSRVEGYLVSESEILDPNAKPGTRTPGTLQICTLRKAEHLSHLEFSRIWRDHHTAVAVNTQSTFGYRQNQVILPLTDNALDHSAIVEEHFPAKAMSSYEAFFDAEGDEEKLQANLDQMMQSCVRFLDPTSLNVVHLSEYEC